MKILVTDKRQIEQLRTPTVFLPRTGEKRGKFIARVRRHFRGCEEIREHLDVVLIDEEIIDLFPLV